MTHQAVVVLLESIRTGARWNLSGDINNQSDLDNNLTWLDGMQAKPTLADLGL